MLLFIGLIPLSTDPFIGFGLVFSSHPVSPYGLPYAYGWLTENNYN
ncbi:hypothetical protein [Ornithobacterium rhinotracheale]|uniref:Uncharacterized protein n=1 Tax=Ornithobacterium rhinotracheale (strain ATCC 51463 / DSM 15997 / CCUG 23171 / CIP 104009 / LMG 9086) TaxID=867902 RepID=I3ZXW4_ORNRL|nr:hypothetical protein Ornrh_0331 [Ornithobacterium rhinotracheale DSM 15997]